MHVHGKRQAVPLSPRKAMCSQQLCDMIDFNLGLTGTEMFCFVHYIAPRMFSQWIGLKCLFIVLRFWYTATGHEESPGPQAAQHWGVQFPYKTPRKAASPQSRTTRFSDYLRLLLPTEQQSCRTQGRGERHFTWLILLPHQTQVVSATRDCGSPLTYFGAELWQFGQSFWLYVSLSYCIITCGRGSSTVDIHRNWRVSATRKNE